MNRFERYKLVDQKWYNFLCSFTIILCMSEQMITPRMADQKRSDLYVVFTMILFCRNFYVMKLAFIS